MNYKILGLILLSSGCQNDKISELEKKMAELEKKVSTSETRNVICYSNNMNIKKQLNDKEKDLKDCAAYVLFKGTYNERGISYDLIDVLKAGCVGHLKMNREHYVTPEPTGKLEVLDSPVRTSHAPIHSGYFGGQLQIHPDKKYIVPPNTIQDKNIDLLLTNYNVGLLPIIVLGKMYEFNKENSGGTLLKGVYNFKYNVVKNESQQLVVTLEGKTSQRWSHRPGGQNADFHLTATCKTLEEMDAISTKNAAAQKDKK